MLVAPRVRLACLLIALFGGVSGTSRAGKESGMSQTQTEYRHTNRLIDENSPYLLSHAHNPVNWYPWGDEALARAREENKPIFLSIGYAACHWCHVMERESFENDTIAAILNEHFVAIKVDREQRPDLDQIYMSFTMALTGSGGWPMSVFLTPDLKPFFAGTYFPPDDAYNRPGFKHVITEIAMAWEESPNDILESSSGIFDQVTARLRQSAPAQPLTPDAVDRAADQLRQSADSTYGGFGAAPKFPHALELLFCLHRYRATGDLSFLQVAEKGLAGMARGGIYDHLGGGFARYSTDAHWLVPHFEKMLYDNALLVPVYVEAFRITGKKLYLYVVRETLDFLLREMTNPEGGLYSALDADSDGEEGKFYIWTKAEIDDVLGEDAALFCRYYNVTLRGNFEGKSILNVDAASDRLRDEQGDSLNQLLERGREKLLTRRNQRVRPSTDDKILTSWNGLALSAFCQGYQITGDKRYLDHAVKLADFIRTTLDRDGHLTHAYRNGKHSDGQFLEDYAFLLCGVLDLYETDPSAGNARWLTWARDLAGRAASKFMDEDGTFYLREADQTDLIVRPKDETDSSLPAPGSIMIGNLVRLSRLTEEKAYERSAATALGAVSGAIHQYPGGMTSALLAFEATTGDRIDLVVVGDGSNRDAMLAEICRRYIPNRLVADQCRR